MMHFTKTGWLAFFSGTDELMGRQLPVEGWEPLTNAALVVDPERGALRPVTDYPDFWRLERAHAVAAVLPGSGHRAHWNDFENGTPLTEEILGWLVTEAGDAIPFTADGATAEDADEILPPLRDAAGGPGQ
ncbi:hypothetical protein [Streptomyces sp. NPDC001985]|uniref:hypothetical protein n=1 Tax=Streptomyces sp. NPDC001985 TaxID=3154406 RepID=UPI0033295684